MLKARRGLLATLTAGVAAIAFPSRKTAAGQTMDPVGGHGLVGPWTVTSMNPSGRQTKILLTFTADGSVFRTSDTHPVQGVGHGSWALINDREFDAMYVAMRFDEARQLVGTQKTRIRIMSEPGSDEFTGMTKVSMLDVDGNEQSAVQTMLVGSRLKLEAFDA